MELEKKAQAMKEEEDDFGDDIPTEFLDPVRCLMPGLRSHRFLSLG